MRKFGCMLENCKFNFICFTVMGNALFFCLHVQFHSRPYGVEQYLNNKPDVAKMLNSDYVAKTSRTSTYYINTK